LPSDGRQEVIELIPQGVQPVTYTEIQCLECGRWLGHLSMHLRSHDLDAAAYRQRYSLATSHPLAPPQVRETLARKAKAQYPSNTGLHRKKSPAQKRKNREALALARRENAERAGYHLAMRELWSRRSEAKKKAALDRYHVLAKAAGFRGLKDMLRRTWTLTDKELGDLLDRSESTGGYIRTQHGQRPEHEQSGVQRRALQYTRAIDRKYDGLAQAAGYPGIKKLLDQTRALPTKELAQLLGMSRQAAGRLRHDPSLARMRPGDGSPIEAPPRTRR
jgi:hypothetical protein